MKKKTDTKTTEEKLVTTQKVVTALKSETAHFVIGLLCVSLVQQVASFADAIYREIVYRV